MLLGTVSVWYYFRVSHLLYDLLCVCFVFVSSAFILVIFMVTKKVHTDTVLPEGIMFFSKQFAKIGVGLRKITCTRGYRFCVTILLRSFKDF